MMINLDYWIVLRVLRRLVKHTSRCVCEGNSGEVYLNGETCSDYGQHNPMAWCPDGIKGEKRRKPESTDILSSATWLAAMR
jgi:hypothetical protein